MYKTIVTGGAGFIGSHIVDMLVDLGHEVHIVDNMYAGKKENINPKATLHEVDIRNIDKLKEIFKGTTYVFHEAALPQVQYSIENPIETNEVNVVGTLNVLEACRVNNVKRVIFASTCAIYGDNEVMPLGEDARVAPMSPYAIHKYIGEFYMKLYSQIYNLETVCLRYFNVYGMRASVNGSYPLVIARFLDQRAQGKPLLITGDGNNTRDYVNVLDIARANIMAMDGDKVGKGEVINIACGKEYSVNQIAELIGGEIEYIPPRIEPKRAQADITKAKTLLGWEPSITLSDALLELKKYNNIA
jgi:UDP-glucose 4-epimerase